MAASFDAIIKQIARRFHSYSTILLKLFIDKDGRKHILHVGSGTFVKVGKTHGILTAQHCTVPLRGNYFLGLSVSQEGQEHNFLLERSSIRIIEIAIPTTEEFGPDLAFIVIADWVKIETIKASKVFYDLSIDVSIMLNDPPPPEEGIWYVCGVPYERIIQGKSMVGFDELIEFEDYCCAVPILRQSQRNDHDYYDMDFSTPDSYNIPNSFEGMSGGALWHVPGAISASELFSPDNHYFSGVIFYQHSNDDTKRFLRCHGRRSVYKHVVDAII